VNDVKRSGSISRCAEVRAAKSRSPLSLVGERATVLCFLCAIVFPAFADNQEESQHALEQIQTQIKDRQAQLQRRMSEAEKLQNRLKKAELAISALAQNIIVSERNIDGNVKKQKQLIREKESLVSQKNTQKKLLARQVRSAFMNGNNDYAKMLLNQEDAGKFERVVLYYRYLNEARSANIANFQRLVLQLLDVAKKLKATAVLLREEREKQLQQRTNLETKQQDRQATLSDLRNVISSEAVQIEQLQINEQNLVKALEEAKQQQETSLSELTGLGEVKGKLLQPADGKIRKLFGKRRQGQVRWKGVLFHGDLGSPISAIHHGKVLFADWLRGFGLMVIVDHGDGYMSLYGQNQALLKQAGDFVQAGETIGLLGQSGGQNQPSLYFEIRHKGQAINPSKWLQK